MFHVIYASMPETASQKNLLDTLVLLSTPWSEKENWNAVILLILQPVSKMGFLKQSNHTVSQRKPNYLSNMESHQNFIPKVKAYIPERCRKRRWRPSWFHGSGKCYRHWPEWCRILAQIQMLTPKLEKRLLLGHAYPLALTYPMRTWPDGRGI